MRQILRRAPGSAKSGGGRRLRELGWWIPGVCHVYLWRTASLCGCPAGSSPTAGRACDAKATGLDRDRSGKNAPLEHNPSRPNRPRPGAGTTFGNVVNPSSSRRQNSDPG